MSFPHKKLPAHPATFCEGKPWKRDLSQLVEEPEQALNDMSGASGCLTNMLPKHLFHLFYSWAKEGQMEVWGTLFRTAEIKGFDIHSHHMNASLWKLFKTFHYTPKMPVIYFPFQALQIFFYVRICKWVSLSLSPASHSLFFLHAPPFNQSKCNIMHKYHIIPLRCLQLVDKVKLTAFALTSTHYYFNFIWSVMTQRFLF